MQYVSFIVCCLLVSACTYDKISAFPTEEDNKDNVAPCRCGPKQWESAFSSNAGAKKKEDGSAHMTTMYGTISLDYPKHLHMSFTTTTDMEKQAKVEMLQDYDKKKQYYVIDGNCYVTDLTTELTTNCLPDNATLVSTSYLGAGVGKLATNIWEVKFLGMQKVSYTSVTAVDCIPIGQTVLGDEVTPGAFGLLMTSYLNVTTGIKDPNIFKVPASCKQISEKALKPHYIPLVHKMTHHSFNSPISV